MKIPTYLTLSRHNVFYFRYPIPASLHPKTKQTDIRLSLETRCPQTALQMVRSLVYLAEGIMQNPVIRVMDYHEIRAILSEFFKNAREKTKERIARYGQLQEQDIRSLRQTCDLATQALQDDDFSMIGDSADLGSVIKAYSLTLDEESKEYELFRTEYVKAYRDYSKSVLEYNSRFDGYEFSTAPDVLAMKQSVQKVRKIRLADAIDTYIDEKQRMKAMAEKSLKEFKSALALLSEYLGEDASLHLSSDIANDVKRMLMSIPKFARSRKQFKEMTIPELMKLEGHDRLSPLTIAKYIEIYSLFYDWAVLRKETDENNFKNLVDNVKGKGKQREAFQPDQMKLILDEARNNTRGLITNPSYKWGILIAMYTGARLNEIAQMQLDDLKEIDGIWCFDFNDKGENKKLKNKSSARIVPIHSNLIELGILAHRSEAQKDGKDRLLYDLPHHKDNGYGRNLSRWFGETFTPKMGLKKEGLVFHSFRHTVIAELLKSDVSDSIVKAIAGHSDLKRDVTQGIYGKGYKVSQLQQAIEKLVY